jgi:hypothetical protein
MAPTHAQTLLALAALRELIAIDGVHPAELKFLHRVEQIARVGHATVLIAIRPQELAVVFRSPMERRRLVRFLVLGALSDGVVTDKEMAWVRQVAMAVRIDDPSIEILELLRAHAYSAARARLLAASVRELVSEGWDLAGLPGAAGVLVSWSLLVCASALARTGLPPLPLVPPTGELLACLQPWLRRMIVAPESRRLVAA